MQTNAEYQRFSKGATSTGVTTRLAPVAFDRIDDYVIVARLGQGGMAEVFLALSVGPSGFRKLVAIKRLYKQMQNDASAVDLFLAEASLAARLQHSNVVQTHKVGTCQGQHFIAMEYLDGQPLNRVLNRLRSQQARLPVTLAVQFIADALEGLHYAHEARDYDGRPLGIIHRDVSPHNIFVTFDGQVKLLDFGIARVDPVGPTALGGIINGKFAYMAPEQALGEYVDRRADVWGMGITLWECLAGQRLFRGCNDLTVMQSSLTEDIPWVSDVAPEVPEPLALIVSKALQRDPQRRYATALKFKEDLCGWLATQQSTRSRATASTNMHNLFSDTIERRRETLRECLARVDASDSTLPPALPAEARAAPPPITLAPSMPPPLPVRAEPRPGWVRDALPKAFAFAIGAVIAILIGVYFRQHAAGRELPSSGTTALAGRSVQRAQPPLHRSQAAKPIATRPLATGVAALRHAGSSPWLPADATRPTAESKPRTHKRRDRKVDDVSDTDAVPAVEFDPEPVGSVLAETAPVTGRLVLDSTPYAVVTLHGKRLGITPIDVELPAATHTLGLRNPERGIETTYLVTIPAGQSIRRRVALDQ